MEQRPPQWRRVLAEAERLLADSGYDIRQA
jgi:hypothetical protein